MRARILYIEDNEDNVYMLARRLRRKGYEVVVASDGEKGVEMARADAPSLILMDLSLPVLDGWRRPESSRPRPKRAMSRSLPFRRTPWKVTEKVRSPRAATTTTPSRSNSNA